MTTIPPHVRSGDLITAEMMNAILDVISDLQDKINQLNASSPKVEILSPLPTDFRRIGDQLHVIGRNFGLPEDNLVFLDSIVSVSQFSSGSNDQLLVFDIPFVQNVPQNGRSVTLTVKHRTRGSASTSFELAQPVQSIPTGVLTIQYSGSTDPIKVGPVFFTFTLTAATTDNEVYTIDPRCNNGWTAELVDGSDRPIEPAEIFIAKPATPAVPTSTTARIRVTIPDPTPVGTKGALTLKLTSKRNPSGLTRTSDETTFQVGSNAPPPEKIAIIPDAVFAPGRLVNDAIELPLPVAPNDRTTVYAAFQARTPVAGAYSISKPTFKNDPAKKWSASVVNASAGIPMSPPQANFSFSITALAGATDTTMAFGIVSDSDASITGSVNVVVRMR